MTFTPTRFALAAVLLFGAGCKPVDDGSGPRVAVVFDSSDAALTGDDPYAMEPDSAALEVSRQDGAWMRVVQLDSTAADTSLNPETLADLTAERLNTGPMHLPIGADHEGPSVLRIQVLLDRAGFSPGSMDGRWGQNTAKAVYWLQKREALPATARVDRATFEVLARLARAPQRIVTRRALTAADVEGPFAKLPANIYDKAKLDAMGYESLTEKLAEAYHVAPALLRRLNPGVVIDSLAAGDSLTAPDVARAAAAAAVARIAVSGEGNFVHALDAQDRIVYHFPSTLGASYDPSPDGDYRITSVTENPWWHYQPAILASVDDSEADARIPPGPNNAVGRVWMALSKRHYGIHGTSAPETIGYAASAGCVRLTNWDVLFLSQHVKAGTPVNFANTSGEPNADSTAARPAARDSAVSTR